MFTGIVEEVGTIIGLVPQNNAVDLRVQCRDTLRGIAKGDSIAVDGVCLTVTAFDQSSFVTFASAETLRRTSLVFKKMGEKVNLERPLTLEKKLGGHIMQGHVDGIGHIGSIRKEGEAQMWRFLVSPELGKFMVSKGSVGVDGISLTVIDAELDYFTVSIIPRTLSVTTFQFRQEGDPVNVETDIVGKYVYRFMHPEESSRVAEPPSITLDLLRRDFA